MEMEAAMAVMFHTPTGPIYSIEDKVFKALVLAAQVGNAHTDDPELKFRVDNLIFDLKRFCRELS
jgi:hypothetical protein